MITRLDIVSIVVTDQERALDFYTNKLGFEKRADRQFKDMPRFLTVAPKGQTEPEIVLVKKGASNIQPAVGGHTGLVFRTDDCRKDYTTLKERGVQIEEPMDLPFGIQALVSDPDGNLFFIVEPRTHPTR